MFLELLSILLSMVPDYLSEYMTKIKIEPVLKILH